MEEQKPPVQEGQELTVTIEYQGRKGDGVAKVLGYVIMVPNTKIGENPKIKITKILKKMAFGEKI